MTSNRTFLETLFSAAVHSCLPSVCLEPYLRNIDVSKGICVIGAGKAAADMAATVYRVYGDKCYGKVVTRYGYETSLPTGNIEVLYASHPVPDENSLKAGQALLALASETPIDIPIIFLISGGGSALLSAPAEGITFSDKIALHKFLLRSGASIDEMNLVRKELSAVKGGRLAQQIKTTCHTYVLSDVVGDNPSLIASGPTYIEARRPAQALAILEKYNWQVIPSIATYLKQQAKQTKQASPEANTSKDLFTMVGNAHLAIDTAISLASEHGWQSQVISYEQEGEAKEVAKQHAKLAIEAKQKGQKILFFSGGELTVTVKNDAGQGGPNQEYLLAMAIALQGESGITVLSCDTDGVDGSQDVAGGYIDENTLKQAQDKQLDPTEYLNNHDSYTFLNTLDSLVVTGPTSTNVNDFRVIMVNGA